MDLTTPQKRKEAKQHFQIRMGRCLAAAIKAWQSMDAAERKAFKAVVGQFNRIRKHLEQKAIDQGISRACKAAIPDCRGDCCRWHFPTSLSTLDFLIAVCHMTTTEMVQLQRLAESRGGRYQCPFLQPDGCVFTFEQRPLACTVAYPCHAGESYHRFADDTKRAANRLREKLWAIARKPEL